jgi:hypothetical protein
MSRPGRLYSWERPGIHCTGGWVGPRASLDRCGISRPHWDSIPGPSRPVVSRYTNYAILAPCSLQVVGLFNQSVGLNSGMGKGLSSRQNIQTHYGPT